MHYMLFQTEAIFEILKAWLKRAPSLKGAALVKLSQLRVQISQWPFYTNSTAIASVLNELTISSDNWYENVLEVYKYRLEIANENSKNIYNMNTINSNIEVEESNQTS